MVATVGLSVDLHGQTTSSGLPREGLVALWSAEANARDSAGRNHGKLSGDATFAAGKIGLAFRFDGKLIAGAPAPYPAARASSYPVYLGKGYAGAFVGLIDEALTARTDFGQVTIKLVHVRTMRFDPGKPGLAVVTMLAGTILRGRLVEQTVTADIAPGGPRVKVKTARIASIARSGALPPPEIREKVAKLIAQLGAESYKDREAAAKALLAMGKSIIPLLRPHLRSKDAEVCQRIEDILEQLGVTE